MRFSIALILLLLPLPALAQEHSTCFAYFDGRYVDLDFCQAPEENPTTTSNEPEPTPEETSATPEEPETSSDEAVEESSEDASP